LAKKRGKVTELHSTPRKTNDDVRRRVVLMLQADLVIKLKTKAFEAHQSVQKFASEILTKHLEK